MKTLYRMINILSLILLSIALFFSLQSSTFTFFGLGHTFYLALLIMLPVIFLILVLPSTEFLKKIWNFTRANNNIIFWILFTLLIVLQLILINTFTTDVTSDAKNVLANLAHPSKLSYYLSMSQNNSAYVFLSYFISKIFGTNLIIFKYFTLISLDISVVLLRMAAYKYFNSRSIANTVALVFAYFTMLQPIFVLPYTDTFALPYVNLTLLLIISAFQNTQRKYLYAFFSGMTASFAYLLRPSSIIFLFAFLIFLAISVHQAFGEKKKIRTIILLSIILFGTFFISNYTAKKYFNAQTIIKIDKSQGYPLVHFALLGSYGDPDNKNSLHGTFNGEDFNLALSQPNREARKKPELDKLIARTKERGIVESFKFYMVKFSDNMDTGVVGFHREQLWTTVTKLSPESSVKGYIERAFYQKNLQVGQWLSWSARFLFFLQLIWLVILTSAIYAIWKYRENDKVTLVSLSLLGGMLFLLIFESGGTKYMLQYTPFISVLSGFGLYNLLTKKRLM